MQTPDQIVDEGFAELERRMARLRLTASEVIAMSGMSYATYWRAKPRGDDGHAPANLNSRKKTLGRLEVALDAYEAAQRESA